MIFAAGLGTRLRPLTDHTPKALIKVAGKPMLEHVILRLKAAGFEDIVINIHHLGEQIIEFLHTNNNFGINIRISDERDFLLDTGGGIKKAQSLFSESNDPILIHNADILSDIDLNALYQYHAQSKTDATLLVSHRKTIRYLLFDKASLRLKGWINKDTLQTKPEGFVYHPDTDSELYEEYAFSGIHVISPSLFQYMDDRWTGKFSIMDFYLKTCTEATIGGLPAQNLHLIDIGKPETLPQAEEFLKANHLA